MVLVYNCDYIRSEFGVSNQIGELHEVGNDDGLVIIFCESLPDTGRLQ